MRNSLARLRMRPEGPDRVPGPARVKSHAHPINLASLHGPDCRAPVVHTDICIAICVYLTLCHVRASRLLHGTLSINKKTLHQNPTFKIMSNRKYHP